MNLITYQLQSASKKTVEVPEEYARIAEDFVKNTAKKDADMQQLLQSYSIGDQKIMGLVIKMKYSAGESLLRQQDELYLRVCLFLSQKENQEVSPNIAAIVNELVIPTNNAVCPHH